MPTRTAEPSVDTPRYRTHGDPSGGQRRPEAREQRRQRGDRSEGAYRRPRAVREEPRDADGDFVPAGRRSHGDPTGERRRPAAPRSAPTPPSGTRNPTKQRRSNVLFVLVIITACTLFLAVTTGATVMLYGFVLAALALCGYVYMLAQSRQRTEHAAYDDWLD